MSLYRACSDIASDLAIAGQSCRELFWDIADVVWHVRSQFQRRQTVQRLAQREDDLHRQLGRDAFALLADGVSVQRTPHLDATLNEIRKYEAMRQQQSRGLADSSWDVRAAVSTRRLTQVVRTGSWQIHAIAVATGSPWIGRSLPRETPTGVCLAVQRDQSLHPFTLDWRVLDGDVLMVFTPPSYFSDWNQLMTQGPADATDTR